MLNNKHNLKGLLIMLIVFIYKVLRVLGM